MSGHKVTASHHAVRQAQKRVPALSGLPWGDTARYCCFEARAALDAGRRARTMPRWCVMGKRANSERKKINPAFGVARFVWDEQQTMVMVIRKISPHANPMNADWLLLTVMVPRSDRPHSYRDTPS